MPFAFVSSLPRQTTTRQSYQCLVRREAAIMIAGETCSSPCKHEAAITTVEIRPERYGFT